MNMEQLHTLIEHCKKLGIQTMGELGELKKKNGCQTNAELLGALDRAVKEKEEVA